MRRLQVTSSTATPARAPTSSEWLTLEQASRRLGIHATTLRRWAREGQIDFFLTPGGHRRFLPADLERFELERRRHRLPTGTERRWADHALAQVREEVPGQRWLAVYDEAEREVKRRLGRRLMGLVFQYVARADEADDLLLEARSLGSAHAQSGLRFGQPLADLLQAISFFRTTLVEVAILEQPGSLAAQPEASSRLLRRVEGLLLEVQAGVVDLYLSGGSS